MTHKFGNEVKKKKKWRITPMEKTLQGRTTNKKMCGEVII